MITYKELGLTDKELTTYSYIEYQDDIKWVITHEIVEQVEAHNSTYLLELHTSTNPNGGSVSYKNIRCITYEEACMLSKLMNVQPYQCTEYMELLKEYPDAPAEWLNALGNIR